MNRARKIIGAIIGIIAFSITVVSLTFAYYTWRGQNTDITFNISDSYFFCESGATSTITNLNPIANAESNDNYKAGSSIQDFHVNNIGKQNTTFSLNLKIDKSSSNNDTYQNFLNSSVKYKVLLDETNSVDCTTNSCTTVASGNFADFKLGMNNLVQSINLPNNVRYHYYLFIYIGDGQTPENIQSSSMKITLDVCEIVAYLKYNDYVTEDGYLRITDKNSNDEYIYGSGLTTPVRPATVVTYHPNGGQVSTTSATIGASNSNLATKYTFNGWKSSVDNQIKTSSSLVGTTENHTLTAQWTAPTLTLPTPTKTGYTFAGWYDSSNTKIGMGGETYNPDVILAKDKTSNITLTAHWTPNTYNIAYNLNNGTHGSSHPTSATYDTTITISNPTKSGYSFTGWTSTTQGSNAQSGTSANNLSSWNGSANTNTYYKNLRDTSGTTTLTANWTVSSSNEVTLTIKKDGSVCTECDGYIVNISSSSATNTASFAGTTTTSSSITITGAMAPGTTYYVWVGKDANHKSDLAYSGVSFTGAVSASGTINFYTLTVKHNNVLSTKVNGTSIENNGTVVLLGGTSGTANNYSHTIESTVDSGYEFSSWSRTGTARIENTSSATTTIKIASAATITANGQASSSNKLILTIYKDGELCTTCDGYKILVSNNKTAYQNNTSPTGTTTNSSSATITGAMTPGTTYYVWAGMNSKVKSFIKSSGVSFTGAETASATINYYTLTTKLNNMTGTINIDGGVASDNETLVMLGGSEVLSNNQQHSTNSSQTSINDGYVFDKWTYNGSVSFSSTTATNPTFKIASAATITLNAKPSSSNKVTFTINKDGEACTDCNGYRINISTSDTTNTASFAGTTTTASAATVTGAMAPGTTYYVWVGKDANHKTTVEYSGVSFTGGTASTGTIDFYTLTVKLNNVSTTKINNTSVTNNGTVVLLGGTSGLANNTGHTITTTTASGYEFSNWTKDGTIEIDSNTSATTTLKIASAGTITANGQASSTNKVKLNLRKNSSSCTNCDGYVINISSSSVTNSASFAGTTTTASSTTITGAMTPGTKYYVWVGKDENHKNDLVYSGVSFTGTVTASGTIDFYTLTVKRNNVSSTSVNGTIINDNGTVVLLGGTSVLANNTGHTITTTTASGYEFSSWTKKGTIEIVSTTSATTTLKIAYAGTITANASASEITFNSATLTSGTYGTAYTSNAFTGASNGSGNYTYTITGGTPTTGTTTINSSARTISFSNNVPAGTYNIVVKATDNVISIEKSATMTIVINKAAGNVSLSPTAGTLTYETNGTSTITKTGDGTLSCTTSSNAVATCSISGSNLIITPAANTADNKVATITVTLSNGANYTGATATYIVTVNRKELTCPSGATFTYNGNPQNSEITCPTGSTSGGTASATNAGTYTQTCSATTGYKFESACTPTWYINKATCLPPTSLEVNPAGIVTWTASSNATSYQIGLTSSPSTAATNGINYKNTIIESAGTKTVYVRSICNTTNYTSPSANATTNVTVYTATINKGAGIGTITLSGSNTTSASISKNYISGATVSIDASVNTGYTWSKWNGTPTTTTKAYSTTITSNWNSTATTSSNGYTIEYTLNGGTYGSNHPTSGFYDSDVQISNPTRTGFTFTGWTSTTLGPNAKSGTTTNPGTAWSGSLTKNTYFKNLRESGTVTMVANWTDTQAPNITLDKIGSVTGFKGWELGSGATIDSNGYLNIQNADANLTQAYYYNVTPGGWKVTFDFNTSSTSEMFASTGGYNIGVDYYDSSFAPATASNNKQSNGNAGQATALNTWTSATWDNLDLTGIDYAHFVINHATAYTQPPTKYRNFTVSGKVYTNDKYTVNVTASDNTGVTVKKYASGNKNASYFETNGSTLTQNSFEVTENGTYTVYASDAAGNTTVQTIVIDRIDKTPPVINSITYSNGTVTALATDSQSGIVAHRVTMNNTEPTNWDKIQTTTSQYTRSFDISSGGTYYVWFVDAAQNVSYSSITVPVVAIPTSSFCKSLTYNGSTQTLVSTAAIGFTWTAGTTRVDAGSQTVTATLSNGYIWNNGTTGTKTITCSIAKQQCLAPTNITINPSGTVTWTPSSNCSSATHQISTNASSGFTNASSGVNYNDSLTTTSGTKTVYVKALAPNSNYIDSTNGSKGTNVYSVELTKGTGISDVKINNSSITSKNFITGATVSLDATVVTGYTWNKWNGTPTTTTKAYSDEISSNWSATATTTATLTFNSSTLTSGTYGTDYTSNAFGAASNGSGNYSYTITGGTPTTGTTTLNSSARTISFSNNVPAGTYNVVVKATDTTTSAEKSATMTIVINKISAVCPTSLADYTGTYDGSSHSITASGQSGGTIQYRTATSGTGSTWTTTKPTATNASTTTVYVRMVGDANHSDVDCGSKQIKIAKYTPTMAFDPTTATSGTVDLNSSGTFTVKPTTISACLGSITGTSANIGYIKVTTGTINNAASGTSQNITYQGVGITDGTNINVRYNPTDTANCNTSAYINYNIKVNRIPAVCPTSFADYTGTYNASSHTITASGHSGGTLQYRTATSGTGSTWTTTKPSETNAGTTTVYVKVAGDASHTDVDCGSKQIKIAKYTPTMAFDPTNNTSGTVDLNSSGTFKVKPTTIAACLGSITGTSANIGYIKVTTGTINNAASGTSQNITYQGVGITDGTNINVRYNPTDTANCNTSAYINYNIKVNRIPAVCPTSLADYTGTYDGSPHSITASGHSGGTLQYRTATSGTGSTWTTTKPTATNAGTTTVYVKVAGDASHTDVDCGSKQIKITKYTPTMAFDPTTAISGTVDLNSSGTFKVKPTTISACLGSITGTSANIGYIKVTTGTINNAASGTSQNITYQGVGITDGTNINVRYNPTDTANCNTSAYINYNIKVNRIPAVCPTSFADFNGTYDGTSHTITASGQSGGTIQYRTATSGTGSTWTTTKPTATNASTTTVYVRMVGDASHTDSDCGSKLIKIAKYTPTMDFDPTTTTSGTVNANATGTFKVKPTTISACLGSITGTSANTSYVKVTAGTINNAANATSQTITYQGAGYTTGTNINVRYNPTDTTNCNNSSYINFSVVVNRLTPTISLTAKTAIYTGSAISANAASATQGGSAVTLSYTYTYYSGTSCGTALSGTPTNVGEYSVKAISTQTAVYSSATSSCTTHTINNAKLTFNATANSGTLNGTSPQYVRTGSTGVYTGIRNSTTGTIPLAGRTGYTWSGWYTGQSSGSKVINTDRSIVASISNWTDGSKNWLLTADNTVYARYTANTYTIAYALNSGTHGTNHPTSATYDTTFTVNNPTRDGYMFKGWTITGMDSVTHTLGSAQSTSSSATGITATSFKNLRSTTGTVTFTAVWADACYQVGTTKYSTLGEISTNGNISTGKDITVLKNCTDSSAATFTNGTSNLILNNKTITKTSASIVVTGGTLNISGGTSSTTSGTGKITGEIRPLRQTGGVLNIKSGVIESTADTAIIHRSGGTLNISGGTVTGSGNCISSDGAGATNISGGFLNTTGAHGTVYGGTTNVTISGGTLQGAYTGGNTAIVDILNGTVTVTGGLIKSSSTAALNVGINVREGSKLTYSNGNILTTRNAIYLNGGTATINSGSITTNGAYNTIGMSTVTTNTLTIANGTITNTGNTAVLRKAGGTLSVTGGSISGQKAALYITGAGTATVSGGILDATGADYTVNNAGTLTISGTAQIKSTGTSKTEATVYSNTGVTNITGGTISHSGTSGTPYMVQMSGNNARLNVSGGNLISTAGAVRGIHAYDGAIVTFASATLTTTGISIVNDNGNVTINGGGSITTTGAYNTIYTQGANNVTNINGSYIRNNTDTALVRKTAGTLTISNTPSIAGTSNAISATGAGKVNINGGNLSTSGAHATVYGGTTDISIAMTAGSIVNSSTSNINIVDIAGGTLTVTAGTIKSSSTSALGTGIAARIGSKVTISNSTITTTRYAVYNSDSTVTINGGASLNTSGEYYTVYSTGDDSSTTIAGSNIRNSTDTPLVKKASGNLSITGGNMTGSNNAVHIDAGPTSITGGNFSTTGAHSTIYVAGGTTTINASASNISNSSTGNNSVVYATGATSKVDFKAGTIKSASTASLSRGIEVAANATAAMSGGTVDTTADAIRATLGTVTVSGGLVRTSGTYSTFVVLDESKANISGGQVRNSGTSGRLVYHETTTTGTTTISNSADINGTNSAAYIKGGRLNIQGGTLNTSGNNDTVWGGTSIISITNGTITNSSTSNRSILRTDGGTITVGASNSTTGPLIKSSSNTAMGVGIAAYSNAKVVIFSGTINSTRNSIYNGGGTITISGGSINSTGNSDGKYSTIHNGTVTTNALSISNGTITNTGGSIAIYKAAGTLTMSGGSISTNNYSLYLTGAGLATITGGVITSSANAYETVVNSNSTLTIRSNANIRSDSDSKNSGIIRMTGANGVTNIQGGTITNVGTGLSAWGVRVENGVLNMSGGVVTNQNGYAVYVTSTSGKFNLSGGAIYHNQSASALVTTNGSMTMSGGYLCSGGATSTTNTLQVGEYVDNATGTLFLSGGTITNLNNSSSGDALIISSSTKYYDGSTLRDVSVWSRDAVKIISKNGAAVHATAKSTTGFYATSNYTGIIASINGETFAIAASAKTATGLGGSSGTVWRGKNVTSWGTNAPSVTNWTRKKTNMSIAPTGSSAPDQTNCSSTPLDLTSLYSSSIVS